MTTNHNADELAGRKVLTIEEAFRPSDEADAEQRQAASLFLFWPKNAVELAQDDSMLPTLLDELAKFIARREKRAIEDALARHPQQPPGRVVSENDRGLITHLWARADASRESSSAHLMRCAAERLEALAALPSPVAQSELSGEDHLAIEALRDHREQIDEAGIMVAVSREAVDHVVAIIDRLTASRSPEKKP